MYYHLSHDVVTLRCKCDTIIYVARSPEMCQMHIIILQYFCTGRNFAGRRSCEYLVNFGGYLWDGSLRKSLVWGEVWIFSGTTQCYLCSHCIRPGFPNVQLSACMYCTFNFSLALPSSSNTSSSSISSS